MIFNLNRKHQADKDKETSFNMTHEVLSHQVIIEYTCRTLISHLVVAQESDYQFIIF